ncbi:MAG TPA: YihY/virulence factor BrkB family protein [Microbacteriaceae bacterium]|nr:YihY/virulence factor BrkB family protein [Microbacteriaceae bacterium]
MRESSVAKAGRAPDPEAPGEPEAPTQIPRASWRYIIVRSGQEFLWDDCMQIAAALTYYAVLSLFPALLAVVAVLGLVGKAKTVTDAVLSAIGQLAPGPAVDLLRGPVHELATSEAAGLALVVGVLGALWSASAYVRAFGRAVNRVYEVDEGRPFWRLVPTTLAVTVLGVAIAAVMSATLALSGGVARAVGNAFGVAHAAEAVWSVAKWPVLVALAIVAVSVLYYVTPNVRRPKFRWVSIGAAVALALAALATTGFAFYVANFAHYNKTYGAIGSVIILLIWVWIVNLALLFGAEFDSEVERGRQLQAGIRAERAIQLPPRDDRQSVRRAAREEKAVARGRELRERLAAGRAAR